MGFPLDLSRYTTPPFYSEDSTNAPGLGAILTNPDPGMTRGVPGGGNPDPGIVPGGAAPQAPNSYDKRRLTLDTMQTPRAQAEAELANEKPNWGMGKKLGVGALAVLAGAFSKGHGAEVGQMLNPNARYQRKLSERIAEIAKDQQFVLAQQQERARIDAEQRQAELQDAAEQRASAEHGQRMELGQQAIARGAAEAQHEGEFTLAPSQVRYDAKGNIIAQAPEKAGSVKRTVSRPTGEVANQAELDSWNKTNEGLKAQLQSQTAELQKQFGRFKSKKEALQDPTVASLQSQVKATQDAIAQHGKGRPKAVRGKATETRTMTQEEADQVDARLARAQAIVDGKAQATPEQVQLAQDYIDKYGSR